MSDPAHAAHLSNRLSRESSPYLLQHARNPVDWYPWGDEAFEAARTEDKPIFLSVGYSTCYWCHVMERQCFENPAIAAEMNQRFINIKVDREERPDVDQLYMTAVQVLTRHGGWPMSVFLTPDLRPFYGGTYFPPTDMHGRPGFVTILKAIEDAYKNRRADVEKSADQLVNILQQYAKPIAPSATILIDDALVEDLIRRSVSDYDSTFGGFGGAPKFPRETLLELLLAYLRQPPGSSHPRVAKMLEHTLDAMAAGGIRDQLGGGFHRYSTDAQWLVPHFEIMLYDNAMLGWCYIEAFAQTKQPRYTDVARGIFDFILREMTSPAGGFYTALDAEVNGQEGLNYLWTGNEIESILGLDDARLFNKVYGIDGGPNFADPHHGTGVPDKNILFLPTPLEQQAAAMKINAAELQARLAPMRIKLYQARLKRKQPLRDTKIITSWNALMIRALAHGGKILGEPRYLAAAEKAADFVLVSNRTSDGGLFRTSRDGAAKTHGFLDDYAFFTQALLALLHATGDAKWKDHANALADQIIARFGGEAFYFTEKNARDLIIRQITASDSPLPSGNAVAAMALLESGHADQARGIISAFAQHLTSQPEGMSSMVQSAIGYLRHRGPLTISLEPGSSAANRPISPGELAQRVVTAQTRWISDVELVVQLNILRGYHINSHDTGNDASLIATRLTVAGDAAAEVFYPRDEALHAPFADGPIRVYSGEIEIRVKFARPREAGAPANLNLLYQACDESTCLPPVTREIRL